jgi:hypothetical protein
VQSYENTICKLNFEIKRLNIVNKTSLDNIQNLTELLKTSNDKIEELELELDYKDSKIKEMNGKLIVHEKLSESYIKHGSTNSTNTNSNNTSNVINNNNNIIVSNLDILENPDKLRMLIEEHYSPDYFKGGQQGVAKFSNDHLITDDRGNKMYICTDVSRNSFKYRNSSGDLIKDPNCSQLVNSMLDNGLKEVAYKHSNSLMDKDIAFQDKAVLMDTYFDIASMDTEAAKFSKCLREMNCK